MDAANKENSLIPTPAKATSGDPGSDSLVHDQNLQQSVAQSASQVLNTKIEPADVAPEDQEESFTEKVGEDFQALNPFYKSTVRYAPNTDKKKEGFLNVLLGRMRRQHPTNEIKEKS